MKHSLFSLFFLLFCNCLNAQTRNGIDAEAYKNSAAAFAAGKIIYNNSYTFTLYRRTFRSFWSETTFVVRNGKVVARSFRQGIGNTTHKKGWEEVGKQLGSHKDQGEALITMDEIYAKVGEWVANTTEKPKDNVYYFNTFKDGILSTAGFSPENCEDCFTGYEVWNFKWKGGTSSVLDSLP